MALLRRLNLRLNDRQRATLERRIVEAMREVGVLLFAFIPLDYVMRTGPVDRVGVAILFAVSLVSFTWSIILESRAGQ